MRMVMKNVQVKSEKKWQVRFYITDRLDGADSGLGLTTDFEVLAALKDNLVLEAALGALETEHNLLGSLSLLVEDGLGLTTETRLLPVITALA